MASLIVLSAERWQQFMEIVGQANYGMVVVQEGVIPDDKMRAAEEAADTYDFGDGEPNLVIDIVGIEDTAHHFLDVAGILDEEEN